MKVSSGLTVGFSILEWVHVNAACGNICVSSEMCSLKWDKSEVESQIFH